MGKKRGRHQSLDKEMKQSVRWLENQPAVSKIVLSLSESCRHKYPPGHLRFKQNVEGGIKINGYSGRGVTDIFVKIDPMSARDEIKALLEKQFN